MVGLIYHHVLLTGDAAFLNDRVNGRSILDWAIYQAEYGDDPGTPAGLMNYHYNLDNYIELRRDEYHYRHVMPCLNSRRCESYRMVDTLCRIAGRKPPADFLARAGEIKTALGKELWDAREKWFGWIDAQGEEKQMRYTAQILKMLDTGALDREQADGLVSHLNEEEFLSEYGLHSISKKDPAYDQDDVDCGGGGICTSILPIIVERLYRSGHADAAADILKRTLWWGERLPYYADSQVSNFMDYRHDSPIQNLIGALSGAQCIIYGMFGVKVTVNDITINPVPPAWSPDIRLKGLHIRGLNMDINVRGKSFEVLSNGTRITSKTGTPVILEPPGRLQK